MTLPNFLIIGAAKSGTTALHHYLKQHPQIYMSPVKEPNFFAFEGKKLDFHDSGDRKINQSSITYVGAYRAQTSVTDIEAYRALFQGVSNEIAIGEASPLYLYSLKAAERIKHYIPDTKLIAILRNPVERAYSSFLMRVRQNRETLTDFAQALQVETRLHNNLVDVHYVRKGFYYAQLKRYFDLFNQDQIKVYLYEDLTANAIDLLRDLFQFLNVDETFVPDTSIRHNASGIPKNKVLHHTLQKELKVIKAILKLLLPVELYSNFRARYFQNNLVKPQLSPEVRKQLIEVCQEDVLKLEDLLQRDLSKWLE